jgi:hypothetical protein
MVSVVAPIGTWSSLGSCLTLTLTFFFATDAAENYASGVFLYYVCFLVKWIPGRGPEQRESGKTVLYPLIIIT